MTHTVTIENADLRYRDRVLEFEARDWERAHEIAQRWVLDHFWGNEPHEVDYIITDHDGDTERGTVLAQPPEIDPEEGFLPWERV